MSSDQRRINVEILRSVEPTPSVDPAPWLGVPSSPLGRPFSSRSIYVKPGTLRTIFRHVCRESTEAGGLLVGRCHKRNEDYDIALTAALPATTALGTGSSLLFTADSWLEALRAKDSSHRDDLVLGWYHSHPGIPLVPSDEDVALQSGFFPRPWNIFIIVDPLGGTARFWFLENGQPSEILGLNLLLHENVKSGPMRAEMGNGILLMVDAEIDAYRLR